MPARILCIYCLQERPEPARGEHLLLAGLGGATCTKHVCEGCNNGALADLDREFLRSSTVTICRIFAPSRRTGEVAGPQFMPLDEGGYADYRLLTPAQPYVPAQLFFKGERLVFFHTDEHERERAYVEDLTADAFAALPRHVQDRPENDPARIVFWLHRGRVEPLLRARTPAHMNRFLAALGTKLPFRIVDAGAVPYAPPSVPMRISQDLNTEGRCAAKMIMNLTAHHLGPRALYGRGFDAVRAYILGTDVRRGGAVSESGEAGVIVDRRYLRRDWWEIDIPPAPLEGRDYEAHALVLDVQNGRAIGDVILFGGVIHIPVRLGLLRTVDPLPRLPVKLIKDADQSERIAVSTIDGSPAVASRTGRIADDSRS
jgi:hypothetical protein